MSAPNLLLLLSGVVEFVYAGSGGIVFGGAATTAPGQIFAYVGSGGIVFGGVAESSGASFWTPQPPTTGGWTPVAPASGAWSPTSKPTGPWVPVGG